MKCSEFPRELRVCVQSSQYTYDLVDTAAVYFLVYFTRLARKYIQFISLASTSRFSGDQQRTRNLRRKGRDRR